MKTVKRALLFFMVMLFLSGLTAIPVVPELKWLAAHFPFEGSIKNKFTELLIAITTTEKNFPNLLYGYDWLAFAHFILAILFIGPYRDPVRNTWVIDFGIIACILIIPFAFVAGHYRQVPVWWRLVDCSFGVLGLVPLLIAKQRISDLQAEQGFSFPAATHDSFIKNNRYEKANLDF